MPPPRKDLPVDDEESEETSSGSESGSEESSSPAEPVIPRRHKFDDEEDESDVVDAWDEADDSEAEAEKAKKAAEAKAKADAEAAANKKSKAQRIEEKRMANMRKKMEDDAESSSEEEDEAAKRARVRRTEQEADLKNAEDLFGSAGLGSTKDRGAKPVVVSDPKDPDNAIDLANLPLFNPQTKDQFLKLRETLVPILGANAKKAQYTLFMQEFTKQIVRELPSEQIKKIASGLTALANEKMKEEKAAEKGGKKSKAAKSKVALVANRDTSYRADTTSYGDGLDDDDDFM